MRFIEKRMFKDQLYEQFAQQVRALANPHRLEILDLLAQGERTVDEIAKEAGLKVGSASQHLQVLRQAGILRVRREGLFAYYRLADEQVCRAWSALRELSESQNAEVERLVRTFLSDRDSLQQITQEELRERMADGETVVLDVRPAGEYRSCHIRGARSIPIDELERRLSEVPTDKEIVAYCRGPYCVFADEAVSLLRKHGIRARRLEVGLPDWRARGYAVTRGETT